MFVCIENAGRRQIAEGLFKKNAPTKFKVQSAGTKPVSQKIC
jgi:protein-tyrosine-phosphatase